MTTTAKFSLSIQVNQIDTPVSYSLTPGYDHYHENGLDRYEWIYNPKDVLKVQVILDKPNDSKSYIVIRDLIANNVQLHDIDTFGSYLVKGRGKIKTYGHMAESGTYTFKVRYSPIVHNYISWVLTQSTPG